MIRIAIVEDELDHSKLLSEFCNKYAMENKIDIGIKQFDNGFDFMTGYKPCYDLIFLDIKMPYMNGMQTAHKLREIDNSVCIIFITNMSQYAIQGYDVGATDFIVKPIKYDNFSFKFKRALSIIKKNREHEIIINCNKTIKCLKLSEIYYIETLKHRLFYHTVTGVYETWDSMKHATAMVNSPFFVQCNNGYLVNLRHVSEINDNFVTVGGDNLQISRAKRKKFIDSLTVYVRGVPVDRISNKFRGADNDYTE